MNKLRIGKLEEWQDTGVNFAFIDLFLWNHLLVEQVEHRSLTNRYMTWNKKRSEINKSSEIGCGISFFSSLKN